MSEIGVGGEGTGKSGGGDAYRVGRRLGGATASDVYEAAHPRLPGRFAIKFIRRSSPGPEAIEAFKRTAEQVSALRHPNIAFVLELGVVPGGAPFVVMEFLEGRTLEERLSQDGPRPLIETISTISGIASGLAAAHATGVVHGELRPGNVFLAELAGYELGFPKILDFGSWHLAGPEQHTSPTAACFVAPEQAQGRQDAIDGRTDQFALAAIAYRMLAGVDAFPGSDVITVLYRVLHEPPRPLAELCRCDPHVDAVIRRGLAKDPQERFESVLAFARALEEAGRLATAGTRSTVVATPVVEAPSVRAVPVATAEDNYFARAEVTPVVAPAPLEEEVPLEDEEDLDQLPRRRWAVPVVVAGFAVAAVTGAWALGWRPPLAVRASAPWRLAHLPGAAPSETPAPAAPIDRAIPAAETPTAAIPPQHVETPARAPAVAREAAVPPAPAVEPDPRTERGAAPTRGRPAIRRERPIDSAGQPRALRGYVWSPKQQRLVPTTSD